MEEEEYESIQDYVDMNLEETAVKILDEEFVKSKKTKGTFEYNKTFINKLTENVNKRLEKEIESDLNEISKKVTKEYKDIITKFMI